MKRFGQWAERLGQLFGQYRKQVLIGGAALAVAVAAFGTWVYTAGEGDTLLAKVESVFASASDEIVPPAEAAGPFAFERLDIDTSKPQAEACLAFNRDLVADGKVRYADYVDIKNSGEKDTADIKAALRVTGPRLCIAGLEFNASYDVTLKVGFPAANGEKLLEAETVPVELRDKPSVLRFAGGIILPREAMAGVPLISINVDKAKIKVIRVGDRLLSQIETGSLDEKTIYYWSANEIEENQGALIWQGTVDIKNIKNASVTTLVSLDKAMKDRKPGAYVIIAVDAKAKTNDDGEYDYSSGEMAVQWVVDSDVALTTFSGGDGLSVFARSYASAEPMRGVKLKLIARDNNELATVVTDGEGRATFSPGLFKTKGGDTPVMVMAYYGKDFSFVDLRRSSFDLTDRGVSGREVPGPVDAFLYTERGVYRAGETVQVTAMLRDALAAAKTAPLTLVATRPDGMEVARKFVPGNALAAGVGAWSFALSKSAPHGRWTIAAYIDPKADPVGRVQFDVHDFVPQKLKVALAAETKWVKPGDTMKVRTESRFLYGAPAGGLSGEGLARIVVDPAPFEAYAGWQFGRMEDKFDSADIDLTVPNTDAAGVTYATAVLDKVADTTLPLKAKVRIDIHEPGGRTTAKSLEIPIRNHEVLIGIRPDFSGGSVNENAKASFAVMAVNAEGKRIALRNVNYSFTRVSRTYQWYRDDSGWKYKATVRERLVAGGTVSLGKDGYLKLGQALPWGEYRLTVSDPASRASTSYRYWSGWAASSEGDRPDRIPVIADKKTYRAGETAHVRVKPQGPGKALVVVANERILFARTVDMSADGTTVDVPVRSDWGAGAYVLVTSYRPLKSAVGHEPVRAIGLAWLALDNGPRTLVPVIGAPNKITPRQRVMVPIEVKGLSGGEQAFLTLSAVDEGILQLTDYESPDPTAYYYGKRRLGVEMRDDYGRLIKKEKGDVGAMREGGDAFGGRALAVVPTKTVALFSGIVKVGADGKARIPLDVPDFNGELRLMAVAFANGKLGASSRPMTVRDAVVADLVLPRFLAPGDAAQAALNLNNVEGKPGTYTASFAVKGPLALAGGARQMQIKHNLKAGERTLVPVEVRGTGLGVGTVVMTLTGPGGFKVVHDWQIEVRPSQLDIARDETVPLGAKQSWTATASLIADLVPGSSTVGIDVSAAHGFSNVPALLKWLDKYPFGCLEQTTSRALPLLFFNDLAALAGIKADQSLKDRMQASVDRVLDMQDIDGSFGMWGPGIQSDSWVGAFALDFLMQAKAKNYVVPNAALARGMTWLKRVSTSSSNDDNVRAYAFYLLARAGQVNVSDLRYFSDTRGPEWNTVIAPALVGAAASHVGDRARTTYAFKRALDIAGKSRDENYPIGDYGSYLRDLSAAVALASEAGEAGLVPAFLAKLQSVDMRLNYTTTQEKAWMLRAAYELTRQHTKLNILVNGKPVAAQGGAVHLAPDAKALAAGLTILNAGDGGVWRSVSVQGMPSAPLPASANGVTLQKAIYTLSGTPVDPNNLHQNDRVIVVLSGQTSNNYLRQMGAIDLLPAGLEIERPLNGDDAKRYSFLGTLTDMTRADASDDRFVAAFTIGSRYRSRDSREPVVSPSFRIGYVARVVTEGTYVLPAGYVVDMYAPQISARTAMGKVTVKR